MKKSKFLNNFGVLALILHFILMPNSKAQIPINDPAWVKDTTLSDDFNGTALNTKKWYAYDNVPDYHSFAADFKSNVIVSSGNLTIHADTLNPNKYYMVQNQKGVMIDSVYQYQGGQIFSICNADTPFKYGYLEISAKYPIGNIAYWPAFWLIAGSCPDGYYNEIDIAENGYSESYNRHEYGTNFWWFNPPNSCIMSKEGSLYDVPNLPRLDSIFHKYACQWDVDKVTFYFDDIPVRVVPNSVVPTPNHYLKLAFDFYITPWSVKLPHMPPANYVIDYFHYYRLNVNCQNQLTISNPVTNYYHATPARAIEESIHTVTVGSSSPTFNLSDSCTLRATDYILLDVGTTINGTGTGQFSAIITPCPQ